MTTKVSDHEKWISKEIELDPIDYLLMQRSFKNEYLGRKVICSYVEQDTPIPDNLKPLLFTILMGNFKGKKKAITFNYWQRLITDVAELVRDESIKTTDAIERVSNEYGEQVETLNRRYYSKQFSYIRKNITDTDEVKFE